MAKNRIYIVEARFEKGWRFSYDAVNPWGTKELAEQEAERMQSRTENENGLKYRAHAYIKEKR